VVGIDLDVHCFSLSEWWIREAGADSSYVPRFPASVRQATQEICGGIFYGCPESQ